MSALLRGLLQLVQLMVLARLLTPEEFGQVATAIAIIAVASLFSDLGLNSAYLHARNVNQEQRSALYWINVLAGASMTLLVILASPLADFFVDDAKIGSLLNLYALIFLVSSAGTQLRFDAEKRLEFNRVAIIEVSASTLGVCVVVTLAILKFGTLAIVYGALAAATTNTCLNWIFLAAGWRPGLRVRLSSAQSFLPYGFATIGNGMLNQFSTNLDMLVGGRLLGIADFGLYAAPRNLFNQILALINPVVTRVGFPLVAHLDSDRDRIARVYEKMLSAIVGVNAPIYFFAAFFAEPLVILLFGNRWANIASVFAVLALWGLSRSIMNPTGNLLFGTGRPELALRWNFVQMVVAGMVLPLASGQGPLGLALIMMLLIACQIVPAWYFLIRPVCALSLRSYLTAIGRPLLCALLVVAITAAITLHLMEGYLIEIGFGLLLTVSCYVIVSWYTREEWMLILTNQIGIKYRS